MQIKTITVNAAGLSATGRGIQGTGLLGMNQVQTEINNMFAPECKVTISEEGRKRSRQQTAYTETSAQSTYKAAAESNQLCQQEERKGLRESLTEMYQRNGFTGEELLKRVNDTYQEIYRRAQGGIQFSMRESSEEAMAAVKELAQKARKVEDIMVDPSEVRDIIQAAQEYQKDSI